MKDGAKLEEWMNRVDAMAAETKIRLTRSAIASKAKTLYADIILSAIHDDDTKSKLRAAFNSHSIEWVKRFLRRHSSTHIRLHGEGGGLSSMVHVSYLTDVIPELVSKDLDEFAKKISRFKLKNDCNSLIISNV